MSVVEREIKTELIEESIPESPNEESTRNGDIDDDNNDDVDDDDFNHPGEITGRESPLTDIATSPPPFELSLRETDLHSDEDIHPSKIDDLDDESGSSTHNISPINDDELKTNGRKGDSYESSELSDLGDDDSEAETDKMDFLDDNDSDDSVNQKVSDLKTLSKLTELARLRDVDSDFDEDDRLDDNIEVKDEEDPVETKDEDNKLEIEVGKRPAEEDEDESLGNEIKRRKSNPEELSNNESDPVEKSTEANPTKDSNSPDGEVKTEEKETMTTKEEDNENTSQEQIQETVTTKDQINIDNIEDDNEAEAEDEDNAEEEEDEGTKPDESSIDGQNEDHSPQNEEKVEVEEEEVDTVDLNEQRKLAIQELISIESKFAELRDKLYQDKLSILERELQLCLEGSHPELSKIYYKINGFYQDSLKLANSNLAYKLKCIDKETMAARTSIHQDFLKNVMELKNSMITETTSLWYKINKERNQLDQLVSDFNFTAIPTIPNVAAGSLDESAATSSYQYLDGVYENTQLSKKAIKQNTLIELVQQRNNVNHQIGILNGLVQFHGFPAAINATLSEDSSFLPDELLLKKATDDEIKDDLKAMGIQI